MLFMTLNFLTKKPSYSLFEVGMCQQWNYQWAALSWKCHPPKLKNFR